MENFTLLRRHSGTQKRVKKAKQRDQIDNEARLFWKSIVKTKHQSLTNLAFMRLVLGADRVVHHICIRCIPHTLEVEIHTRPRLYLFGRYLVKAKLFCRKCFVSVTGLECSCGKIFILVTEISVPKTEISLTEPARPFIWTHRYFYKEKSGEARSRKPSQPGWPGSYEEGLSVETWHNIFCLTCCQYEDFQKSRKKRKQFLPCAHDIAGSWNRWKHGGAKCWLHCMDYNCFGGN